MDKKAIHQYATKENARRLHAQAKAYVKTERGRTIAAGVVGAAVVTIIALTTYKKKKSK